MECDVGHRLLEDICKETGIATSWWCNEVSISYFTSCFSFSKFQFLTFTRTARLLTRRMTVMRRSENQAARCGRLGTEVPRVLGIKHGDGCTGLDGMPCATVVVPLAAPCDRYEGSRGLEGHCCWSYQALVISHQKRKEQGVHSEVPRSIYWYLLMMFGFHPLFRCMWK